MLKVLKEPKALLITITLLSFLGFLDATFLTIKHYQGALPPCHLQTGCEKVLTSQYATIGNVPIALLGTAFYLTVMGFAIIPVLGSPFSVFRSKLISSRSASYKKTDKQKTGKPNSDNRQLRTENRNFSIFDIRILFLLVLSGFLVSLILFLIQAFILRSYCQYCIISEIFSTLLLIFSVVLIRSKHS